MISFNTNPNKMYIHAMEDDSNSEYRTGPIEVKIDESYWILTTVNNMCPDKNIIAENVRLSVNMNRVSPTETIVESAIICEGANPKVTRQNIKFVSDTPFELEYFENSAYLYSELDGFQGSKGKLLTNEIMTEQGTLLGFTQIDGRIPGGGHNAVTVSIKVRAKRRLQEKAINSGINTHSNSLMTGMYLGQSGFFIESKSATMLFDWHVGTLPTISKEKPLHIFISHVHNDHFNPQVFNIADNHPHAEIFLGYDSEVPEINQLLDRQSDKVNDNLCLFDGCQKLYSDDEKLLINTLTSTDLGVAFIVEIDGKTLYHAGDLFLMHIIGKQEYIQMSTAALLSGFGGYEGTYEDYLDNNRREFIEYTEPLRGRTIDYAMLPLDSRSFDVAEKTIERYMDVADIRSWSPMHLWGKYEFVDEYLSKHAEYASTMIGTSKLQTVKKQIAIGEQYEIF